MVKIAVELARDSCIFYIQYMQCLFSRCSETRNVRVLFALYRLCNAVFIRLGIPSMFSPGSTEFSRCRSILSGGNHRDIVNVRQEALGIESKKSALEVGANSSDASSRMRARLNGEAGGR